MSEQFEKTTLPGEEIQLDELEFESDADSSAKSDLNESPVNGNDSFDPAAFFDDADPLEMVDESGLAEMISFSDDELSEAHHSKIYGLPIPEVEELLTMQQQMQARAFKIVRHLRAAEDRILEVKREKRAVKKELITTQQTLVNVETELAKAREARAQSETANKTALCRVEKLEQTARELSEKVAVYESEACQRDEALRKAVAEHELMLNAKDDALAALAAEKSSLLSQITTHEQRFAEQSQSLEQQLASVATTSKKLTDYERVRSELDETRDLVQKQMDELHQLRTGNEALVAEKAASTERLGKEKAEREELKKLVRAAMERLERHRGDSAKIKKDP